MAPPDTTRVKSPPLLSEAEGQILVDVARKALEARILHNRDLELDEESLPDTLLAPGCSFVTLTMDGELRGCIGSVYPHQPLVYDVRDNAVKAALSDPRFPPLSPAELGRTEIEVSVLTPPTRLMCTSPEEILSRLRPGVDGVLIVQDWRRGLLLPQVWERIPDPEEFLTMVCLKAGLPMDAWRWPETEIFTFQVQAFHEQER